MDILGLGNHGRLLPHCHFVQGLMRRVLCVILLLVTLPAGLCPGADSTRCVSAGAFPSHKAGKQVC